jgi:D-alanyl-D-alanine carboxypeptidase/D-alanyl-D-alanine-endopeptidase (penicillin-binding protein 4)
MRKIERIAMVLPLLMGMLPGCSALLARPMATGGAPAEMAADLDRIFNDSIFQHANWGVLIRSLESGETVYSRNAERLFIPASNVKIVTAAAALQTLGPEYTYRTTISTFGPIQNGVLEGALVVTGTGDPTISSRFFTDSRDVFRAWADSLRVHGISRVAGGIVAVDTAFAGPTLGTGWMWDDLMGGSAAPFGALQFNENVIRIDLYPSSLVLQPAIVVLTPPTQSIRVINNTRTMAEGSSPALRIERDDLAAGIVVQGEVPIDVEEVRRTVAVESPSDYFVTVLRETLRDAGIAVEGPATNMSELEQFDPTVANAIPLFVHQSPPLREILIGMMKPSQNMIAETLLLTIGRELRGESTADGGTAVVDSLLTVWQISPKEHRMEDGSGLSRYDLASPALLVGILETMDRSGLRDDWLASLPIAGRDGTLEDRMRDPPLLDQVRAKTGTLSNVRSLSGYLTDQRGDRFVFSIIANNHLVGSAEVDRVAEAALYRIAVEP